MPRSHATSASPEKAAPGNRGVGPFVAPARRPDVCGPRFISTMPKETSMDFTKHPATTVLHSGYRSDPTTQAVAVPIYQTTSHQFEDSAQAPHLVALEEVATNSTPAYKQTTTDFKERTQRTA